jgi:hypothetical protein
VVTQGTHPSKVMAKLAPYTTLSDLAPSVMMTLRALELARLGKPSDSLGQLLLLTDDVVETIHGSEPATLEHVHSQLSWVQGAEPEMLKTVISWLGDTPVGAMATSKRLDKVLLYDHGEDGETLRCREIFEDGLGDVILLRDLDKDEPIVFSGRFDFAFTAEDEEGW